MRKVQSALKQTIIFFEGGQNFPSQLSKLAKFTSFDNWIVS